MVEKFYDILKRVHLSTKSQLAAMISTEESKMEVVVRLNKTQYQNGGSDCGVFAIAFATDLCYGNDPASLKYAQEKMRPHLIECFTSGSISPFPSKFVRPGKAKKEKIELFCSCRLPEMVGDKMAQCFICGEWYHKICEKIPNIVFTDESVSWKCSKCSE